MSALSTALRYEITFQYMRQRMAEIGYDIVDDAQERRHFADNWTGGKLLGLEWNGDEIATGVLPASPAPSPTRGPDPA